MSEIGQMTEEPAADGGQPRATTYDVVVIGGGQAGCAAALEAAAGGLTVALVDQRSRGLGGAFVHENGLPARVWTAAVAVAEQVRRAGEWAVVVEGTPRIEAAGLLRRRQGVVSKAADALKGRLRAAGVEVLHGRGFLAGENSVAVLDPETGDEKASLAASRIVVATGAEAVRPDTYPFDSRCVAAAHQVFSLKRAPASAVVVGTGPEAIEAAGVLAALGASVTCLPGASGILPEEDADLGAAVRSGLERAGVVLMEGANPLRCETDDAGCRLTVDLDGTEKTLEAELLVVAAGRKPRTDHLGLRKLGIETDPRTGAIDVDASFTTSNPAVFAVGECVCAGLPAVVSRADAIFLGARLAGRSGSRLTALDAVRACRAGDCLVAAAGHTVASAGQAGHRVVVGLSGPDENLVALAVGGQPPVVRLVVDADTGELLGAGAIGSHAPELVAVAALARRFEYTVADLAGGLVPDPEFAEPLTEAARHALTISEGL